MKNAVIIGVLLVLLGAAAYYYFSIYQPEATGVAQSTTPAPAVIPPRTPDPEPAQSLTEPEVVAVPESGMEATAPPQVEEIPLPMLMDSDPLVLQTLGGLIGESAVIQYLVSDNVISRVVATVDTMGGTRIPGIVQVVKGPESEFEATGNNQPEVVIFNEEGDPLPQFIIDPANYKRYTPYVELLEAMDTTLLIENYQSHYPLFQEAYRQMGYSNGAFNTRLLALIDELLATPEVTDPVNLVKPEAFYLFTDPDLESRSAGQKIMLRMGRANADRVKQKLREIRSAL